MTKKELVEKRKKLEAELVSTENEICEFEKSKVGKFKNSPEFKEIKKIITEHEKPEEYICSVNMEVEFRVHSSSFEVLNAEADIGETVDAKVLNLKTTDGTEVRQGLKRLLGGLIEDYFDERSDEISDYFPVVNIRHGEVKAASKKIEKIVEKASKKYDLYEEYIYDIL